MKFSEIATYGLLTLNESVPNYGMPYQYLYHATNEGDLLSIKQYGLQTKFYGKIHGENGVLSDPIQPAIYLSRNPQSNNLNTQLWEKGPVVFLTIDAAKLDTTKMYPDDFIYQLVSDEGFFETPGSIVKALKCTPKEAKVILLQIENATSDQQLQIVLKPFWYWYLTWKRGGEIAYAADIPPELIVDVKPYQSRR